MARYRLGRHNDRIVYRQLDDEPADTDPMVATVFEPVDALAIVDALNGAARWTVERYRPPEALRPRFRGEALVGGWIRLDGERLAWIAVLPDQWERLVAASRSVGEVDGA